MTSILKNQIIKFIYIVNEYIYIYICILKKLKLEDIYKILYYIFYIFEKEIKYKRCKGISIL